MYEFPRVHFHTSRIFKFGPEPDKSERRKVWSLRRPKKIGGRGLEIRLEIR